MLTRLWRFISQRVTSFATTTISGEVSLVKKNIKESIYGDDEFHSTLSHHVERFHDDHTYVDVDVDRCIHETKVSFFALNRGIFNDNFLQDFQASIYEFFDGLCEFDDLNIRVHINGEISNWKNITKFLIVNNGNEIFFKETGSKDLSLFKSYLGAAVNWVFRTHKATNYI